MRSCAFHPTQPLFASAGDDGVVKVFNHRQRKLLFSLTGHLDYVRSVAFHHEAPWIVSASDDQTVRIWNWQSRQCVAILSGHNHYVMCAAFHATEDLLVSASLDQTVRVWDLTNIRAKNAPSVNSISTRKQSSSGSPNTPSPQIDLFAGSGLETSVKFILEGHDRGVNWVQFHPTKPLILSGSDDRTVKIWRFNDVRAWEVETLRGHMNNVSAVLWHPRADFILSDSEDRTLRIWDCSGAAGSSTSGSLSSRGKCALSIKKDSDRFWCLAAHPEMNIFAAGHDNGLVVFKMNRERPAFNLSPEAANNGDCLFYVRDKLVRSFALDSGTDSDEFVAPLDHTLKLPANLSFSPTERAILISSADGTGTVIQLRDKATPYAFEGLFATFVGRNRFVSLSNGEIVLQSIGGYSNDSKILPAPTDNIQRLLPGPLGTFLVVSSLMVYLMDGSSGRVLSSIEASGVKYVSWSPNYDHVALMSKRSIYLSDKHLKSVHVTHVDSTGVKSGTWDVSNVLGAIFYYTNSFHLKYLLPQGDSGIICTTSTPLYLVRVKGDLVHVLDRSASVLVLGIDPTECHFKLALQKGNSEQIKHLVANSNLVGQAIIAYLREKGHAAIALQFVKDPSSRFDLALECDNLEIAWDAAESLKSPSVWNNLAEEALQMGKTEIALKAFELAGNSSKLSFLSTILATKSTDSKKTDNLLDVIINGTAGEITKMFIDSGLSVLGHISSSGRTAVTCESPQLGNFLMRRSLVTGPINPSIQDWPILFDPTVKVTSLNATKSALPSVIDDGWGEIEVEDDYANVNVDNNVNGFGTELDDLDIPLDEDDLALLGDSGGLASEYFDLELPESLPEDISNSSTFTVSQFTEELKLQNGLVAMSPEMINAVERIVSAQTFLLPGNLGVRHLTVPNSYNSLNFGEEEYLPQALQATTQGRFPEALELFRKFLQLSAVSPICLDPKDILLARDYINGLMVELRRKELGESGDKCTLIDLAVLFTRCALKPEHHLLSLRAALASSYKFAAYKTAAHLARRILSLPSGSSLDAVILQARKVLAVAEKANYSESIEGIKYGIFADDVAWVVDPVDFMRLITENGDVKFECQYCRTKYGREHDCCAVCEIGAISPFNQ